jgi:outer membrane lipoprotein-sorting protein
MNRRFFLAGSAAFAALPHIAGAQAFASRDQIATYLNGLVLADGSFTQFNADGSRSIGTFMLQKPGRIRFEYTAPEPAIVVSDGTMVGVIDPKGDGEDNVYELKRTPLALVLRAAIDLDRPGLVRDLSGNGAETYLTLADPENPDSGQIELIFAHDPVFQLSGWTVTDEGGSTTGVRIESMTRGIQQKPQVFSIPWNKHFYD